MSVGGAGDGDGEALKTDDFNGGTRGSARYTYGRLAFGKLL